MPAGLVRRHSLISPIRRNARNSRPQCLLVSCFDRPGLLAPSRADHPSRLLQSVHDLGLVWPPQVQIRTPGDGRAGELGDRLRGILLRRAANRIGSAVYSPAELKTIQEVITLLVFAGFTAVYFKEPLSLSQGAGFGLIALGAVLVFRGQA